MAKSIALFLTAGTTPEPLCEAIDKISEEAKGEALTVFLLYGRPFKNQHPDPFSVAQKVLEHAKSKGISVRPMEIPEPEDLDICLGVIREALAQASGFDKIIINYTGGTKAMSAAAVHSALTEPIAGELEMHYVGGVVRDEHGRVLREAMKVRRAAKTATQERMNQILKELSQHRYELAAQIAQPLPDIGKSGFMKRATKAISLWDSFAYEQALHELRQLSQQALALLDDELIGALAETVRKLIKPSTAIVKELEVLGELQQGKEAKAPSLEETALICADVLENAERCRKRGQFNEAVLRAYRALEVAVQGELLRCNINPWQPDWSKVSEEAKMTLKEELGRLPDKLALSSGISTWRLLSGKDLSEEERKCLLDLQSTRNRSVLEHGYQACDGKDADRCLTIAQMLAERILGVKLDNFRTKVRLEMRFDISA